MTPKHGFVVGDAVELRDTPFDTVGTVVELLRDEFVRVEWNTGPGFVGQTTMISARVLKKRPAG